MESPEAKRKREIEEREGEQQRLAAYRRLEAREREEQGERSPLMENKRRRPHQGASPPVDYRRRRQYPMLAQQEYEAPGVFPMVQMGQPAPMMASMMGMSQQLMPQPMAAPMMESVGYAMPQMLPMAALRCYYPGYEAGPIQEEPYQSVVSEADEATEASTAQTQYSIQQELQAPHRVDMIFVTDELPPMVLERLNQQNGTNSETTGATARTGDDNDIQQIPRAYIPRPAPRAAATFSELFRYPQSSASSRLPRSGRYGRGRYAPYTSPSEGQRQKLRPDRRRSAPSNASP